MAEKNSPTSSEVTQNTAIIFTRPPLLECGMHFNSLSHFRL